MRSGQGRTVLAGVDGSDSATRAAVWAAHEARRRHAPVRLVHAFEWPDSALDPNAVLARRVAGTASGRHHRTDMLAHARRQLSDVAAAVQALDPGIAVEQEVVTGSPVPVLRAEADESRLVVLGSRGLGGFAGLLVGSVSVALATTAPCPVVVVRGNPNPSQGAPVLVGVDAGPYSDEAVGFAFDTAAMRGVPLEVVYAWRDRFPDPDLAPLDDGHAVEQEGQDLLSTRLAGGRAQHPDVPVRPLVVPQRPAQALVQRSERAGLVVVGSRGRGGARSLLLGSVSHALLHHAACPVAVVRPPQPDDARDSGVPGTAQ